MIKSKQIELSNGRTVEIRTYGIIEFMVLAGTIGELWQALAPTIQQIRAETGEIPAARMLIELMRRNPDPIMQVIPELTPIRKDELSGDNQVSAGDLIRVMTAMLEVNDFADFIEAAQSLPEAVGSLAKSKPTGSTKSQRSSTSSAPAMA